MTVLIRAAVRQTLHLPQFKVGEKIEDSNNAGITFFLSMQYFIKPPSVRVMERKLVDIVVLILP
jgi:hypothetical protein